MLIETRPDIKTPDDVSTVIHAFYKDIAADEILGAYFHGLDWATHLPKMVNFWSSIVFHTGTYRGQPFDPHTRMTGLTRDHFARWVNRFHQTVDTCFTGERADLMKARAEQIAGVFQVKLGLW